MSGLAAANPAPAGVTAAAVERTRWDGAVDKTLEITARRREDFRSLIEAARGDSEILAKAANNDLVGTPERLGIETPMIAARAAVVALDLCAEAASLRNAAQARDVGPGMH